MTAGQALTFLLFAVVAAITHGPSNLIVTATGANVRLLRGLSCLGGQVIGMGLMLFLLALGPEDVVLAIQGSP
jgi:threonine/homoserine/homoserine lactone efflux protein